MGGQLKIIRKHTFKWKLRENFVKIRLKLMENYEENDRKLIEN